MCVCVCVFGVGGFARMFKKVVGGEDKGKGAIGVCA